MLSCYILQVIDAGHFWAHPTAHPDFMGKLNDHFRDRKTPEITNPLGKGQVSRLLDCFKDRNSRVVRAGGRGFCPATKRVAPGFFCWKTEEK